MRVKPFTDLAGDPYCNNSISSEEKERERTISGSDPKRGQWGK